MNCRQALKISVTGDKTGNAELAAHLAGCSKCRQLQEIIVSLEQLGGQQRQNDLSSSAVRETRLQAAALLVEKREHAARIALPSIFPLRFLARPVLATLAAASVLISVVTLSWMYLQSGDTGGTEALSASEMAALDSRIGRLAGRLDENLRGFRSRYMESERGGSVEVMCASLRTDIASSSLDIRREL